MAAPAAVAGAVAVLAEELVVDPAVAGWEAMRVAMWVWAERRAARTVVMATQEDCQDWAVTEEKVVATKGMEADLVMLVVALHHCRRRRRHRRHHHHHHLHLQRRHTCTGI